MASVDEERYARPAVDAGAAAPPSPHRPPPSRSLLGQRLERRVDAAGERLLTVRPETWVSLLVIVGCTAFIFWVLHPNLIFTNNTPTGGDMGAHVIGPRYLINHLLPHGELSGWTPDWYAGYPLYEFYMVLPALVIGVLWAGIRSWFVAPALVICIAVAASGWLVPGLWRARKVLFWVGLVGILWVVPMPYGIAFKVVSISGLLTLPLACWTCAKLADLPFPTPPLFALAGFFYVFARFVESSDPNVATIGNIIGGNMASTMAGEYSFSISLSITVVYLGVLSRGLRTGRHRALAAVLLALAGLCHLLPFFFALLATAVMFLMYAGWKRLKWLAPVLVTAALLASFWMLPFYWQHKLTNDMGWDKLPYPGGHLTDFLLPGRFLWVLALAVVGALSAGVTRNRFGWFLTASAAATALAFSFIPQAQLWNARILPFYFLSVFLLAAFGAGAVVYAIARVVGSTSEARLWRVAVAAFAFVAAVLYVAFAVARPWEHGVWSLAMWLNVFLLVLTLAGLVVALQALEGEHRAPAIGMLSTSFTAVALVVAVCLVGFPLRKLPFRHEVRTSNGSYKTNAAGTRLQKWLWFTSYDQSDMSAWAAWNYSGYEGKVGTYNPQTGKYEHGWAEYKAVVDTMARLGKSSGHGCGRALWEQDNDVEGQYGTPMALMLLPYWTNSCIQSMEGLYFESSSTTPYHFLMASEASTSPTDPQRDLPYSGLNMHAAVQHMQLLGVKYYMAVTPTAQQAADREAGLVPVATSGPWHVYQVKNSPLVVGLDRLPAVWNRSTGQSSWLDPAIAWWNDPSRWSIPFAAGGPSTWPRAKLDNAVWGKRWKGVGSDVQGQFGTTGSDPLPAVRSPAVRPAKVSHIHASTDSVSFDVDHVGTPVLVKTSYFPNWKVAGAAGPWRVTPNLMVVVPSSRHVDLHYGRAPIDVAAWVLTFIGIGLVVLFALRPPVYIGRIGRRHHRHPHQRQRWPLFATSPAESASPSTSADVPVSPDATGAQSGTVEMSRPPPPAADPRWFEPPPSAEPHTSDP